MILTSLPLALKKLTLTELFMLGKTFKSPTINSTKSTAKHMPLIFLGLAQFLETPSPFTSFYFLFLALQSYFIYDYPAPGCRGLLLASFLGIFFQGKKKMASKCNQQPCLSVGSVHMYTIWLIAYSN